MRLSEYAPVTLTPRPFLREAKHSQLPGIDLVGQPVERASPDRAARGPAVRVAQPRDQRLGKIFCHAFRMTDSKYGQTLRPAIEIMTALYSEPGSKGFALERLQAIADESGSEGFGDMCAGLVNLAAQAISELSRQSGVPELELLQRFALTVQDES